MENMLDNVKEMLLDMFEKGSTIDYKMVPAHYFLTSLKNELWNYFGVDDQPNPRCDNIVDNLSVNFNGLGLSYEPHKEFLDKLVVAVAKMIVKMVKDVGVQDALRYSKDFKIEIE
jgi:hypothetical protein